MRAVIQRVNQASVTINRKVVTSINNGLLVLLGVHLEDTNEDAIWLANKISNLRIFADEFGKMNKSILDLDFEVIVVSQFTLYAKTKKGNRPSYINAAAPEYALYLYDKFKYHFSNAIGKQVHTGKFGADMQLSLVNDGPVTIIIDTRNKE